MSASHGSFTSPKNWNQFDRSSIPLRCTMPLCRGRPTSRSHGSRPVGFSAGIDCSSAPRAPDAGPESCQGQGSAGSPPAVQGGAFWTVAPEEGRRAANPLGRTGPARRAGWHLPEALLRNRVSCRQTKCQSRGWKPTPTAACMNGEVCRDGTVLVPVLQALRQRSRHTYCQLTLP